MSGVPFRFRLERVRALRERKEQLAKTELANAMRRLSESEDRLRAADERLAHAREQQRSATGAATSGAEMSARQAYLERAEALRRRGAQEMTHSESEVDDRHARLGHAAQERQMLERLKERRRGEHTRELARRDANALDEMAIERFRRSAA